MKHYELIGKKFHKLFVLDVGKIKKTSFGTIKYWKCKCDCGKETEVPANRLVTGKTKSCGCFRRARGERNVRENHPSWKGGKHIKDGYIFLLDKDHPNRNCMGYVAEHVLVMSKHLGRALIKGENVHHKNGQKDDNRIDNLELWSHSHSSGQRVEDKIKWCLEFLSLYGPQYLRESTK